MDKKCTAQLLKIFKKEHCLLPIKPGARFKCLKCANTCCSLPIFLTVQDLKKKKIKDSAESSDLKEGLRQLKKDKNGLCVFLQEGLCSIYSNRPLVCLAYPFSMDPTTKDIFYDVFCKGVGQGEKVDQNEIRKIREEFWNSAGFNDQEKIKIHQLLFS